MCVCTEVIKIVRSSHKPKQTSMEKNNWDKHWDMGLIVLNRYICSLYICSSVLRPSFSEWLRVGKGKELGITLRGVESQCAGILRLQ